MKKTNFLIDTNILIYHTKGLKKSIDFLKDRICEETFNISILTKIEFLGWDKHTTDGFAKCRKLLKFATIIEIDDTIADKAIELRRIKKIKLADAVIAATALVNDMKLATRNIDDFKGIQKLNVANPFEML